LPQQVGVILAAALPDHDSSQTRPFDCPLRHFDALSVWVITPHYIHLIWLSGERGKPAFDHSHIGHPHILDEVTALVLAKLNSDWVAQGGNSLWSGRASCQQQCDSSEDDRLHRRSISHAVDIRNGS